MFVSENSNPVLIPHIELMNPNIGANKKGLYMS